MAFIACPQCGEPVDDRARSCGHCGVDLAMAAVLEERNVHLPETLPEGVPMVPEILVPRLGDYLVDNGELTPDQLIHALAYQKERAVAGQSLLLGQALRELGYIDADALDRAVTVQILQLQTALQQANRQLEQRVQERTQDLQRALKKLKELNQLKANFIANISHELRTPLTHIKGYLDILTMEGLGPLTPEQTEAMEVLQRAESRLERLIEDLIQFSLASRGELKLSLAEVDLLDLLTEAVKQAKLKARASGIMMRTRFHPDLPKVIADEEKINWVVAHLVDNAIKFTGKGGRVSMEAFSKDDRVTVAVTDTGIGIPADRLEEIFEPFHQLDGSATRRYPGTGLGLALSNRIIEAHGSKIEVISMVGKGSRFAFSLKPVDNSLERK